MKNRGQAPFGRFPSSNSPRVPRDFAGLRSGQATLEFALVSFMLILLFMGIYQFGRIILVEQRCQMAVRQGAWLKAHTNMSHRDIKAEMRRFFTPGRERIWVDIARERSMPGSLDVFGKLNNVLNRLTNTCDVSISYQVKTAPYFKGTFPYLVPVGARCTIMRGSWAGIGGTIKEFFGVTKMEKKS